MKKKNGSQSGLANLRTFAAFLFFSLGISMGMMSLAALPAQRSNPGTLSLLGLGGLGEATELSVQGLVPEPEFGRHY